MPEPETKKGLLNQQQFTAVFGVNPGDVSRWISAGMPVEPKKMFNLIAVGQWIVQHLTSGYMKESDTAEMFGIETRTLRKWVNEFGCPKPIPRVGLYKRDDVVQWRCKYLEAKLLEVQAGGKDGLSARKDYFLASTKMRQYQLLEKQQSLVKIDKVITVFERLFTLMVGRKKIFAKKISPLLDGITNAGEREKILNEGINEHYAGIHAAGTRELARLSNVSEPVTENIRSLKADASNARKRARRKISNSKRRNVKRTGSVSRQSR